MQRALPLIILLFAFGFFLITEHENYFTPRSDPKRVIHLWASSTPAQTMIDLKSDFERLHPEYVVEIQQVAWQSLQEKAVWGIAANSNVPDLIVGSSEWTGGLAKNGALEPLDEHFEPQFFDRFFENALGTYRFPEIRRDRPGWMGQMRQYGIPLDLDMMLIYYRADKVEPVMQVLGMTEFPSDWESFSRLGSALHAQYKQMGEERHLIYLDPEDPVPLRMAFLPSSGGRFLTPNYKRAAFNSPEAIAAFDFFANLLHNNTAKQWTRTTMGDPMELIQSGTVLGNIAGPWYGKLLETRVPEQAGRWRVALFPRRTPDNPSCGLGGSCLAMPYNAPNKPGAIALAKYMSTESFALSYFKRVGSPPPIKEAWDNPIFEEPLPYLGGQKLYDLVRHVIETDSQPLELLSNAEVTKAHVRWALTQVSLGDPMVTQTVQQAAQRANDALASTEY